MKKAIAISLLFVLSAPLIFRGLVLIDYGLRFNYYAEVLCENKNETAFACNGTCQLSTLNDKNSKSEHEIPNAFKIEISPFNTVSALKCVTSVAFIWNTIVNVPYLNLYAFTKNNSIYQPPAA
ncbi:MAG: hypothetical protein ACXITV_02285 [Luteibaculaceae bacterium]